MTKIAIIQQAPIFLDKEKTIQKVVALIEDAARLARYEFFASHIHEKNNKSILILGHNFEDQVETILMHIIRGSGLNGLQGMAEMSHQTIGTLSLNIFRPMLSLNRSSILKYCSDNNISGKKLLRITKLFL